MVFLTIVTRENGKPVHFEEPIPKVRFIKLITFSLFNNWHTLKWEGSALLGDKEKDNALSISKIPPGYYTIDSIAKEIDSIFINIVINIWRQKMMVLLAGLSSKLGRKTDWIWLRSRQFACRRLKGQPLHKNNNKQSDVSLSLLSILFSFISPSHTLYMTKGGFIVFSLFLFS